MKPISQLPLIVMALHFCEHSMVIQFLASFVVIEFTFLPSFFLLPLPFNLFHVLLVPGGLSGQPLNDY